MAISKATIANVLMGVISGAMSSLSLHGRVTFFNSEDKQGHKSIRIVLDFDKPSSEIITEE